MAAATASLEGRSSWTNVVLGRRSPASAPAPRALEEVKKRAESSSVSGSNSDPPSPCSTSVLAAIPALAAMEPASGDKPSEDSVELCSCNGDDHGSVEMGAADENVGLYGEDSVKVVKVAWKKPVEPSSSSHWEGAIMGDESWPSLEESRTRKHSNSPRSALSLSSSDSNSEKDPTSASASLIQPKTNSSNGDDVGHKGHRKMESIKREINEPNSAALLPVPRPVPVTGIRSQGALHTIPPPQHAPVPFIRSPFSLNNVGRDTIPNHRGNSGNFSGDIRPPFQRNVDGGFFGRGATPHPQRNHHGKFPGPGVMHYQAGANGAFSGHASMPRMRGRNGFPQNNYVDRRLHHDQGRGNHWRPQQNFPDVPHSPVPPTMPPFVDPRGFSWVNPPVYHPIPGFPNHPGFGMPNPSMAPPYFPRDPGGVANLPMAPPFFTQDSLQFNRFGALQVSRPVSPITNIEELVTNQVEYYFSKENLIKDTYLRSNMDDEGFVPASLIESFNKMRILKADTKMILKSLRKSSVVEVQGENLRRRGDWTRWLLPAELPTLSQDADANSSTSVANDPLPEYNSMNELTNIVAEGVDSIIPEIPQKLILDPEQRAEETSASHFGEAADCLEPEASVSTI